MTCPFCGAELTEGSLTSQRNIKFVEDRPAEGQLAPADFPLEPGWKWLFFGADVPARCCKVCHKIIVDLTEKEDIP